MNQRDIREKALYFFYRSPPNYMLDWAAGHGEGPTDDPGFDDVTAMVEVLQTVYEAGVRDGKAASGSSGRSSALSG